MKAKIILLALVSLVAPLPTLGQVELIKHTSELSGHRALIRENMFGITISYVEADDGNKYFVREDPSVPSALAALVPKEITVNDMEISYEFLYFCGTYTKDGTTEGIVGLFNIPNLYGWGMPYYIATLNWATGDGDTVRMTNPLRVGSTKSALLAGTNIPIVGEIEIRDAEGNVTTQTGLCATFIDVTLSAFRYSYYYTPNPNIVFTDITQTRNYYVAVGRNNSNHTTIIKPFGTTFPFTQHPLGSVIYEVSDYLTVGDVLTTAMTGDEFALVYYYSSDMTAGSTVKKLDANNLNNIPICISLTQNAVPAVSPSWKLREIQYDSLTETTFVLQDMDSPISTTSAATVCEYDLSTPSTIGNYTQPGFSVYGMGAWLGGGFQIVGDDLGAMTLMRKRSMASSSCKSSTTASHNIYSLPTIPTEIIDRPTDEAHLRFTLPVEIIEINFIEDCIKE